jgi:hypothetical protein
MSYLGKVLVGGREGMSIAYPRRDPDSHYIEVPRTGTSYVPEYLPESVI